MTRRGDARRFTRRSFLRLSGAGLLGAAGAAGVATAGAAGGRELWHAGGDRIGAGAFGPPTVVDGTVYVGTNWRGHVFALDASDGAELWDVDTRTFSSLTTAPNVVDGTVYVQDATGIVRALDPDDGSEQWLSREISGQEYAMGPGSPTVADGTVFVANGGGVAALDAGDGTLVREYGPEFVSEVGLSATTVVDDRLFVAGDRVYGYRVDDPEPAWTYDVGGGLMSGFNSAPTVADGTVYVGTGEPSGTADTGTGHLHALDPADGSVVWEYDADRSLNTSPTVADGTVYTGDPQGRVYAFDAGDGTVEWTRDLGQSVSEPTVAGDTVVVGTGGNPSENDDWDQGALYGLDAEDGSVRWETGETPDWFGTPTVVDGAAIVGASDGVRAYYAGVGGHSRGTRVDLGSTGHHHTWAGTPPQTDLVTVVEGTVTDPDDEPVEGVEVVLASSDQAHVGLRLVEEYPDNEAPASALEEPTTDTTGADGTYTLPELGPGRKFLLVVPPAESDLVPTLVSDVAVDEGDRRVEDVALSTHPLALLDPAIEQLGVQSTEALDGATGAAARTLTASANDFSAAALSTLFDTLEQPIEVDDDDIQDAVDANFDIAVGSLATLLDEIRAATPDGFEVVVDAVGDSELFEEDALEDPDVDSLVRDVYTALPPYTDAAGRVTRATEDTYEDLASEYRPGDPALEAFSVSAAADAIRGVVRQLQNPRRGVPGFVVTPTGDLRQINQAQAQAATADRTRQRRQDVATGETLAQVTQMVGGALVVTGVGSSAGATLIAIGRQSQTALEAVDMVLLVKLAFVTVYAQVGWGLDLDAVGAVPPTVVDWLDRRLEDGLAAADLELSDRDLNLVEPLDGRLPSYVVANRPENADGNPLVELNWAAVEEAEIEVANAGDTAAEYRVTTYDFFGGGERTSRRGVTEAGGAELAPGESATVTVEYAATFGGIGDLLEDHTMVVQVWSDGVLRAQETVHFHVRVDADVNVPRLGADGAPGGTPLDRTTASTGQIEDARSASTTLFEDTVDPDDPVVETAHTVESDTREVEYTLSTPGDVALLVTDGDGDAVGYDPDRGTVRTDLPDSEYVGPEATPQTATFTVDPDTEYTVRAVGYGFLRDDPVPVTVQVWERPARDAMVALSPQRPQLFVASGRTGEATVTVAEYGGQTPAEDVRLDPSGFPDGLTVDPDESGFDLRAGAERDVAMSASADASFAPGDPPADTRFEGELAVETADGTATVPVDGLALVTEAGADLASADRTVEGVALSEVDPDTLEDVPDLDGEVAAAYELTVSGTGAVELSLPLSDEDVFGAAYAAGAEWSTLPVGWIDGRAQVRVDTETVASTADDRWARTLVVSERSLSESGESPSGDDDGGGDDGDDDGGDDDDGRGGDDGTARGGDDVSDPTDGGPGGAGAFGPAVGIGGLLAAGAGVGYLLKRRLGGDGGGN